MTHPTMSPMHDQPPALSATPPMANWIAICSIIFGVLGLLFDVLFRLIYRKCFPYLGQAK